MKTNSKNKNYFNKYLKTKKYLKKHILDFQTNF